MEQYSLLFKPYSNLYAEGSPLIIRSGSLTRDNIHNRAEVCLSFRSLSEKTLTGAEVRVQAFDLTGNELGNPIVHRYEGFSAESGDEFGDGDRIIFADTLVRSFEVSVSSVTACDGSVWRCGSSAVWAPLPKQRPLENELGKELYAQYKRETSDKSVYAPMGYKDLWLCSCGTANRGKTCTGCGCKRDNILFSLDRSLLVQHSEAHSAALQLEREVIKAELNTKRRARRRHLVTALCAGAVLAVIVFFCFLGTKDSRYFRGIKESTAENLSSDTTIQRLDGHLQTVDFCEPVIDGGHFTMDGTAYFAPRTGTDLLIVKFTVSGELYSDTASMEFKAISLLPKEED